MIPEKKRPVGRGIVLAVALAIDVCGVLAMIYLAILTAYWDGVDDTTLPLAAVVTLLLAVLIGGAWWLSRKGRATLAVVLALCGAVPTMAVGGLVLLFENYSPIMH